MDAEKEQTQYAFSQVIDRLLSIEKRLSELADKISALEQDREDRANARGLRG